MLNTVITSLISFIGTNIDDLLINTFFFAKADTGKKVLSVVAGKFIGIGSLVLISLLGALGFKIIPQEYIKWLGLVPIALGIKAVFDRDTDDERSEGIGPLSVALITMANGADNIGVYIPLFTSYTSAHIIIAVIVFMLMTALWCVLGKSLASLPVLKSFLQRYKRVIMPVVFIALGVYIIIG